MHYMIVELNAFLFLSLSTVFFPSMHRKKRVETKSMDMNLHVTPKIVSNFFGCFFSVFFSKVIFVVLPFSRERSVARAPHSMR